MSMLLARVAEAKKVRQFEEVTVTDIAAGGNHSLFAVEYPGRGWERSSQSDTALALSRSG